MADKENLYSEFLPVSKEEWLAQVEKELKGRAIEELKWSISEDIVIDPFYNAQDIKTGTLPSFHSSLTNDWEIGEDIIADDPKKANKELLNALENGVNAPRLILDTLIDSAQMDVLFNKVELSFISTHFQMESSSLQILKKFNAFLLKRDQNVFEISGSINDASLSPRSSTEILKFASKQLPKFRVLNIQIANEGIAQSAQDLAKAIARGNEYLSQLSEEGFSIETINQHIQFSISVGSSYFLEISKIRALKMLWLNVMEAYKIKNVQLPPIEAQLSGKSYVKDPNTNTIKATTQAMSAALGGVDRLTILPSDFQNEGSSNFARRIARNVQHILKLESFFDRVVDPAAGSYYIGKLTEQLAESAWRKFQTIEKKKTSKF